MGDRGNIIVDGVYLYSHWNGYNLPMFLQKALKRKLRWDDGAYLTRIIFDTMTHGRQGEETGFGISKEEQDNEHHLIFVNSEYQTVKFVNTSTGLITARWSFQEYIKIGENEIREFFK